MEADSVFLAISLVAQLRISLNYSPPDKNKMAPRFVPIIDIKEIFVLKERIRGFAKLTKKATKFCLIKKCVHAGVLQLKLFVMNKITIYSSCKCCSVHNCYTGAEMPIVLLIKIFSLFFGHFGQRFAFR